MNAVNGRIGRGRAVTAARRTCCTALNLRFSARIFTCSDVLRPASSGAVLLSCVAGSILASECSGMHPLRVLELITPPSPRLMLVKRVHCPWAVSGRTPSHCRAEAAVPRLLCVRLHHDVHRHEAAAAGAA